METKDKIINKIFEVSMLFDFYGELLTGRQKSVMEYYYDDNLSFGEIAETIGISRQAVYDAINKAERSLRNYEDRLGFLKKFRQTSEDIRTAYQAIDEIMIQHGDDPLLVKELINVKEILNRLEE